METTSTLLQTISTNNSEILAKQQEVYDYASSSSESYKTGYNEGYSKGSSDGYDNGKAEGYEEGSASGFEAGQKSEYDRFWDVFQENGKRVRYNYGFSGRGWTDETFKPKYDMAIVNAERMFMYSSITDISRSGRTLDISKAANIGYMFFFALRLQRVPVLDCRSVNDDGLSYMFYMGNTENALERIEKIIVRDDGTTKFTRAFYGLDKLTYIRFEGVIGLSLSFKDCKLLSRESIEDIFAHLWQRRTGTITLNKEAVDRAFETSYNAKDGSTSTEWLNLIATKPNWAVSLIS